MHDLKLMALEIFGGCNYTCSMCPQSSGRGRDFIKKIPYEVFVKVLEDGKAHGCTTVSLHGSGEATLHPEMPRMVRKVKDLGMTCMAVTNAYRLDGRLSAQLIDAGIDLLRVSAIGYDRPTYQQWMQKDAFELVRRQTLEFRELNARLRGSSKIALYHLVLDPARMDEEIALYRRNWVDFCGVEAEIWMMHNWAGSYEEVPWQRRAEQRRTCGRPRAPQLNIRAGGVNGHTASVVPCCFVLGRDAEAVLGTLDTQSIEEVMSGPAFEELRQKHDAGDFDSISYCKDCDQLYDVPESLVWTNIPGKAYGQSKILQNLDFRSWSKS